MTAALQFTGSVHQGKLPAQFRADVARVLRQFEGKVITLSISEAKKKRTGQQNRFYFGVVLPIAVQLFHELAGETHPDFVHLYLKGKVGGMIQSVRLPDGTWNQMVTSSTDLSTQQWEDWLEKIRAWAGEYGCVIPFPNEGL